MTSAEQLATLLNQATSMFALANDFQQFKEGLTDIVRRIEALEKNVRGLQAKVQP